MEFLIQLMPISFSRSVVLVAGLTLLTSSVCHANWPQWRGPLANGIAPDANPPLEWNESKNVKWKVAIPGRGTSTPIIWGDRVFILTAIAAGTPAAAAVETPAPASAAAGAPRKSVV